MARQLGKLILISFVHSVFCLGELPTSGTQSSVTGDAAAIQNNTSMTASDSQTAANPAASASSGNGISQGIVSSTVRPGSEVQENAKNDTSGREYKAADARNQGKTGAAVAIAMGSTFLATGIPMLASPILPVRIAGADLVAKAGLEFAQAGADRQSANKNDAQNKLLRQNADQGGKEATANNPSGGVNASEISSPQLNQFLEGRGIDAAAFTNALASGMLTSPSAVLGALGETAEITAEDQAAADQMAAQFSGNIFAKASHNAPKELTSLMYKDQGGSPQRDGDSSSSGGGSNGGSGAGTSASAAQVLAGQLSGSPGNGAIGTVPGALPAKGFGPLEGGSQTDTTLDALKGLLAGLGTPGFSSSDVKTKNPYAGLSEKELRKRGIIGKGRGNIFQIAAKSYQSFGRWRGPKKKLLAIR